MHSPITWIHGDTATMGASTMHKTLMGSGVTDRVIGVAERKKRAKPGGVVMGARNKVAQFVGERHWTVLSGGELPYPVAVSLAADSDGQPRCTGLVIGMSTSGDADAEVFEITSASARDACRSRTCYRPSLTPQPSSLILAP